MAGKTGAKTGAKTSTRGTSRKSSTLLTPEEKEAMRDLVRERKGGGDGEKEVLAKIAAMAPEDRALAERVHAIVKANAPMLTPKTWYGMPAYAGKDGKVVCFFQDARKFKARYATFAFNDEARLDEGDMWATGFALRKMTPAVEQKMGALVKKAVS